VCQSRRDARQALRGDGGALTLSYVVIIPVFLLAILVIVQACVWYLARETAIAAARQGADVARTAHPPPGLGAQAAVIFARQAAPGFLLAPSASAAGSSPATVRIRVSGRVPSLVPGMQITVSEVVTAPVERFTAAGGQVSDLLAIARLKAAGGGHLG
jgi:Flp pilus assembly protein TadG